MTTVTSTYSNLLPPTDETKKAREFARLEIEKLDALLAKHGHPCTGFLEKPMLLTYIIAKHLGLLAEGDNG